MEPSRTRARNLGHAPRGFTLVEMLVVLGIIVIITAVALLGQTSFNRSLLLTDTAYTMALSVREAQSLGLSSRKITQGASVFQNAGYGVYFTVGKTYVSFADTNPVEPGSTQGGICTGHSVTSGPEARPGDCVYTAGNDAFRKTSTLERGFKISKICGKNTSGSPVCSSGTTPSISALNVVFLRPNTDSLLTGVNSGGVVQLTSGEVYVTSPDDAITKVICISQIGQVTVSASCP